MTRHDTMTNSISSATTTNVAGWAPMHRHSNFRDAVMSDFPASGIHDFGDSPEGDAASGRMAHGQWQQIRRSRLRVGTASVPAREARRRSIAGPIPAVSFATGRYRFTH
ncbi:hypothetical protein [Thermomonas sp.]|uniref:hypothetical protein n=1 Tax=Thermomonas sp. TaxID=1971895 RepID=UPI00260EEBE8|nr:hypothetical protein [Thermomonas sp.]